MLFSRTMDIDGVALKYGPRSRCAACRCSIMICVWSGFVAGEIAVPTLPNRHLDAMLDISEPSARALFIPWTRASAEKNLTDFLRALPPRLAACRPAVGRAHLRPPGRSAARSAVSRSTIKGAGTYF